jgi:hypothetical protein
LQSDLPLFPHCRHRPKPRVGSRGLPAALRCKERVIHRASGRGQGFCTRLQQRCLAGASSLHNSHIPSTPITLQSTQLPSRGSAQPESSSGKTNILFYDIISSRNSSIAFVVRFHLSPTILKTQINLNTHRDALQYPPQVSIPTIAGNPPANRLACSPLKLQIYPKCRSTATTTQKSEAIARRR